MPSARSLGAERDAANNGGFRNPYYGIKPGQGELPGLWLVGDQGVYLLSNGKLSDGERALVVYSEECHPIGNPDWHDYKRRHFGGDDGIEIIDAEQLIPLFDRNFSCTHLHAQLTGTQVSLSLITRQPPPKIASPSSGRQCWLQDRARPKSKEISMSHDDPFTIDLFGNTALSSGLGLGVTAFADIIERDDDDPELSSPAPAPVTPIAAIVQRPSTLSRACGANYFVAEDRGLARGW